MQTLESFSLALRDGVWVGSFNAMGSPCEVLMDTDDKNLAEHLTQLAAREAWRIEKKFSRYRTDNVVHLLNNNNGKPIEVDEETANLLDFANKAYELSDGLFDVTSGVLRGVWKFDGKEHDGPMRDVGDVLKHIGWTHVEWRRPRIKIPVGMELDLGGIGKEYAVDRVAGLIQSFFPGGVLINFGGDMAIRGTRKGDQPWIVGVERPDVVGDAARVIHVKRGALATSGDARRFFTIRGTRYGHILNPKTGWPVAGAPRSVTVAASTCSEAGIISTMAYLQGSKCQSFLESTGSRFWIV